MKLRILSISVFLLVCSQIAWAENFHLNSGKMIQGEIVDVGERSFSVFDGKAQRRIPFKVLLEIDSSEEALASNAEILKNVRERWGKVKEKNDERDSARLSKIQQRAEEARLNMPQVDLYMTSWCHYCRKLERYLRSNQIPFKSMDIERNSQAKKVFKSLGGRGVPLTRIGKTVISGYNPKALRRALGL